MNSARFAHTITRYPAPIRLLVFLVLLALLWLPLAIPIALFVADSNTETILTMSLLFLEFLLLLPIWGKRVYHDLRFFRTCGWVWSRKSILELMAGFCLGGISLFMLFGVQGWMGWLSWQPSEAIVTIALEGLAVALGVGFAEELVFRGWILQEFDRDYSPRFALWLNALTFASLHFLKPLPDMIRTFPQFPGLVILGLALVWAKRSTQGRLGMAIGLHAGLVWAYYLIQVGQLTLPTQQVPEWMTGVEGNPLAGAMGIGFLAGIAWLLRSRFKHSLLKLRE